MIKDNYNELMNSLLYDKLTRTRFDSKPRNYHGEKMMKAEMSLRKK
jgi:hypothetical protein